MKVQSANLSEIVYDGDSSALTVTFKNGRTYSYAGVPEDVYASLVIAHETNQSVGQIFNQLVRSAGYDYTEVSA